MIEKSLLVVLPVVNFNEQEYLIVKRTFEQSYFKLFIASDAGSLCTGQNGLRVGSDVSFFNINHKNFASIVFIGGAGVRKYWNNSLLHSKINSFNHAQKPIGAICSAPIILARAGLLTNQNATCHPEDKSVMMNMNIHYIDSPVVISGNVITAQGPESAEQFSEVIIEKIMEHFSHFR
ncbi:DJ-1/PfpI family protein [Bacteroidota bacterium]